METFKQKWEALSFSQHLTFIISGLGLFFTIAGFALVILSLRSSEKVASTSTYLQTYAWTLETDKAFIDNPKLKEYLYADPKKLKDDTGYISNRPKLEAIAEYMLDSYDAVLNNKSYFNIDSETGIQWMKTVEDDFSKSAILSETFAPKAKLYGAQLNSAFIHRYDKK